MNRKGIWYAVGAYGLWGLLPIYWKLLSDIDAFEILMHRMMWSLVFLAVIVGVRNKWAWIWTKAGEKKIFLLYAGASILLAIHWGLYIWAVNADFIIETSLGYYITPLFSVFFGLVFFQEKLRSGQWIALGIAITGVVYLTINYGHLPWIALGLAVSFSIYGVLKKKAPLGSFEGLSLETAVLFLPALGYIVYLQASGTGALGRADYWTQGLLVFTGVATAIPLLFFAAAAQRIPLTWIGFMQYISPTLNMLIGIFIYHEPFGMVRKIGFLIIWIALIVFTVENIFYSRSQKSLKKITSA